MKCSICGEPLIGKDIHNASPVTIGTCCGKCNNLIVTPARLAAMKGERGEYKGIRVSKNMVFEVFGREFKALDIVNADGDVLCITTEPWRNTFFDDDIARDCTNNFNHAAISRLLTYVFLAGLINTPTDRNLFRIMDTNICDSNGNSGYGYYRGRVRLLTYDEFIKYQVMLNMPDWSWTMTPYLCKQVARRPGDQSLAVVDTRGRYGSKKSFESAAVYPVVTFSHRIAQHESFLVWRSVKR